MRIVYDKIPNGIDLAKIQFYIYASIGGNCADWKEVRYVPPGSSWTTIQPDFLKGTAVYGTPYDSSNAWSIQFDNLKFSRFLFSTTNSKYWLISERENILGSYYDLSDREVIESSEGPTSK